MPAKSDPVPGSVIAIARISSPDATPGNQRCFCSSVAEPVRYGTMMSVWMKGPPSASPTPERAASSLRTTLKRQSSTPGPPYSSGTSIERNPCAASLVKSSRGTIRACSHSS